MDLCRAVFTDLTTGKRKQAGDIIKFPKLAQTYRRIAEEGPDTFYNGSLKNDIIADLYEFGELRLLSSCRSPSLAYQSQCISSPCCRWQCHY